MSFLNRIPFGALLLAVSAATAKASQGPGTSPGTATSFEQTMLLAGIVLAAAAGLAVKFRRR